MRIGLHVIRVVIGSVRNRVMLHLAGLQVQLEQSFVEIPDVAAWTHSKHVTSGSPRCEFFAAGIESDGASAHAKHHVAVGIECQVMRSASRISGAPLSFGDDSTFSSHPLQYLIREFLRLAGSPVETAEIVAEMVGVISIRPFQLQSDRKSTRLNSSHIKISYAIFSLNKKTIIY